MLRDHDKDREPISIHALREEGDENCAVLRCPTHRFYPRPPRGGRRRRPRRSNRPNTHFYPRPPRGGRRRHAAAGDAGQQISIHALREEGDSVSRNALTPASIFLSTPSARRATLFRKTWCPRRPNFYPRPPRGGRPSGCCICQTVQMISIHALREEGDIFIQPRMIPILTFLSTPSARRATTELWAVYAAESKFLSTPSARRATQNRKDPC